MSKDSFIIAEIGSNWHCLRDVLDSIQMAKNSGADAAKLQLFTQEELYGYDCQLPRDYELPTEWIPQCKEKADAAGIELMVTAFSEEGYDRVDPFVKRHKISSAENKCMNLLRKVASFKKPIIYSCGGLSLSEIHAVLKDWHPPGLTLMYCVMAYPSRHHDLFKMRHLAGIADHYGASLGFSDHSHDVVYAPKSACHIHGAVVIEKHFKLSSIDGTPDAPHSLDQIEFKKMVQSIRAENPADPNEAYRSSEEQDATLKHKRRLVAISDIAKGGKYEFGKNFGFFRVRAPDQYAFGPVDIEGRSALQDVKKGKPIGSQEVRLKP